MTKQKESALPAGTEESALKKNRHLHITIKPRSRQILLGIAAWVLFWLMLGIVGGMERETIPFRTGAVWVVIHLILWAVTLKKGGWLK